MSKCSDWLWNLGSRRPGTVVSCLCTNECEWVWERAERGFWSRMAFWRTTAPEIGGGLWVRQGYASSVFVRCDEERG